MIKVEEALDKIKKSIIPLSIIEIESVDAVGRVLAEAIYAPISFPPFNQSAMDGYAINGLTSERIYTVIGEIKAGDDGSFFSLNEGEACRIFTGAMLPDNTTAVIKQEEVTRESNQIKINKVTIERDENVRFSGEQIEKDDCVIQKNTMLNPGAIGFLATIGIGKIKVFKKPKIAIIATGNELIPIGENLTKGKIYESNTKTLIAALSSYGFSATATRVEDEYELIKAEISVAMKNHDLVLITGGISVGDYDYVGGVLKDLEVDQKFHKVNQKPGKPIYFGIKEKTAVFGLPGNPAAVLTSFYLYVLEALAIMIGNQQGYLVHKFVPLAASFSKPTGLTFFLKGKVENDVVTILSSQSSAMLSSFIDANCIVKLEENDSQFTIGTSVEVILLR